MIDVETLMNDKKLLIEENEMLRELLQTVLFENAQLKRQLNEIQHQIVRRPVCVGEEEEG